MKQPAVHMLASQRNGTVYVGVTSGVVQRVWQHKNDMPGGFSQACNVHLLVYFEQHADMLAAITREKQIKKWRRAWKVALIEQTNPCWRDLWADVLG
ncbi:MAG: GIY-YIG nuclease family protein [Polaromonas sp.]|nr:MAG: GIY-YIG nuclease family protein [Polaromonas sp.]